MAGLGHGFLVTFAVVLCTAALTTILFERLKQPVILGYILAGLIIGPHVTLVPIVADIPTTETLAEMGVILLLFAIGLEFSIRRLLRVGGSVAITAILAISLITWLGFVTGRLIGFTPIESFVTGAIAAMSSTTIIAKTFDERRVSRSLKDLVYGVLIVEDLVAILFLAGLTSIAGANTDGPLWMTGVRLLVLLTVWVTAGLLVIPRLMQFVVRLGRRETTLIASLGLCFAFSLLALKLGYSVALGAFIAGSLIAESGKGHTVMELVAPVRDMFAAVFFVAVGMLIDPALIAEHWKAIAILTLVVIFGKILSISVGAFLAGNGTKMSIRVGMSMAQIGEFSFIIASLGVSLGLLRDFLYPIAVAVSAITTLTTPYLGQMADRVANEFDRRLPKPLQTYLSLYATWIESLSKASASGSNSQRVRRMIRWLVLDAIVLLAIIIGMAKTGPDLRQFAVDRFGMTVEATRVALVLGVIALSAPFVFGIFRVAHGLAQQLAVMALPKSERLDLAMAPRRALVVAFDIAIVVLIGVPVVAISQPFLPSYRIAALLLAILAVLSVAAWRSATNLQGHMSAGSEILLSALRHSLPPEQLTMEQQIPGTHEMPVDRLATATHLLPGIGTPQRFIVLSEHYGAGKSLRELSLRGRTGATVLAITRGERGIPAPDKLEVLEPGDQLVLVGTKSAVLMARQILERGSE